YQMHAVYVFLYQLVWPQLIASLHQRLSDDAVADGDHVGDHRGPSLQHDPLGSRAAALAGPVARHLAEGRSSKAELDIVHGVIVGGDADEDGDQDAWHHAVVDHLAGQREALGQALEGHREHQVQADQAAQHQGHRGVGQPAAGVDLTDQRGDTGADDDAALHRVGDQPHQYGAEPGDAEEQEDQEHQELQSEQRL